MVTIYEDEGGPGRRLLIGAADAQLYRAKQNGRNGLSMAMMN